MADHRRDTRYRTRLELTVRRRDESIPLVAENVSWRGAFVRTPRALEAGQLLQLEIPLPNGKTVRPHALVVHATEDARGGAAAGLAFYGFEGTDRRAWQEYIKDVREKTAPVDDAVSFFA